MECNFVNSSNINFYCMDYGDKTYTLTEPH